LERGNIARNLNQRFLSKDNQKKISCYRAKEVKDKEDKDKKKKKKKDRSKDKKKSTCFFNYYFIIY